MAVKKDLRKVVVEMDLTVFEVLDREHLPVDVAR